MPNNMVNAAICPELVARCDGTHFGAYIIQRLDKYPDEMAIVIDPTMYIQSLLKMTGNERCKLSPG